MICRLKQTLATASCPFCTGNMGVTLSTVFSILVGIAVVLLIAPAVWTIWARTTGNEKPCVGSSLYEYFGALGAVAVTACWCLQAGHIYLHGSFIRNNIPEMASSRSIMANAFVLSLLGVCCVIGFDKQADSVQKGDGTPNHNCQGQCRGWHQPRRRVR